MSNHQGEQQPIEADLGQHEPQGFTPSDYADVVNNGVFEAREVYVQAREAEVFCKPCGRDSLLATAYVDAAEAARQAASEGDIQAAIPYLGSQIGKYTMREQTLAAELERREADERTPMGRQLQAAARVLKGVPVRNSQIVKTELTEASGVLARYNAMLEAAQQQL